jgi:hypothetical protein
MLAYAEELRRFSLAQISVDWRDHRLWDHSHSGSNFADNSVDEFLLRKTGQCLVLLTENSGQRVRQHIPCGLNAFL